MIDINLTERKQREPEKPPAPKRKPPSRKTMGILGAAAILVLSLYVFGDTIVGLFVPDPPPIPVAKKPAADTTQVQEPVTEQQPMQEEPPAPEPEVSWDYAGSKMRIESYLSFINALSDGQRYELASVTGDLIIADLRLQNSQEGTLRSRITSALPAYSFSFEGESPQINVQGELKNPGASAGGAPSPEYAEAEANVDAINRIAQELNISMEAWDLTGPITRNGLTVLPGWIKFSGSEGNMTSFLRTINAEGLSLNILKVSGSKSTGGRVNLFLQFQLIL